MRLKSIESRMNHCNECGFTALFMYLDAVGCPLCPKCSHKEIQAFKESISDINDSLEFDDSEAGEYSASASDSGELTELNF